MTRIENKKKKSTDNDKKTSKKEDASSRDPVMKTAFMCIIKDNMTGENKDIPVTITADQIKDILEEWAFTAGIEYWFIEHTSDDEELRPHYHIVIKFRTNTHFSTIKNKFPYGRIEGAKSIKRTVQYLIHLNNPEKIQYTWDQVITNCKDLSPYKSLSRSQQDLCLDRILAKIKTGEITQVNYQKHISIDIYARYKTAINNAFQYKIDEIVLSNSSRCIKIIYVYGKSGIGKSVYARKYALDRYPDEQPCEASAGNDPLQDYRGQKVLILDEFRDSWFKYSDLLKLTDPHTRSSGKSRYQNKHFLGDIIIITTTQRIDFLYKGCDLQDNMYEFRRRISEHHEFIGDKIQIFSNIGKCNFKHTSTILNPFYGWDTLSPSDIKTEQEIKDMVLQAETPHGDTLSLMNNFPDLYQPLKQQSTTRAIDGCEIIKVNGTRAASPSITQMKI